VTTYDAGAAQVRAPSGITLGPDGHVWFTSQGNNRVGYIASP
jgi:streptogramin lyase